MNTNQIYQEVIKTTKTDTTQEQLEAAKLERDNLAAWSNWNTNPQTIEFRRILNEEKLLLLHKAMHQANAPITPSFLIEANTIDKILNSVMTTGIYQTPTQ